MKQESKHCPDCGFEKPSSEFDVISKTGKLGSYCKVHRRIRNNKSNKEYYQKNKDRIQTREATYRGTEEYNARHRGYKKDQSERLTDGIVALRLSAKFNTTAAEVRNIPGLIEAERTRLQIQRKLKEIIVCEEGFRICSVCDGKKSIDNFRLRTEKRNGKKPYTYRAGQCKKCESIIKNSYGKYKNTRP